MGRGRWGGGDGEGGGGDRLREHCPTVLYACEHKHFNGVYVWLFC